MVRGMNASWGRARLPEPNQIGNEYLGPSTQSCRHLPPGPAPTGNAVHQEYGRLGGWAEDIDCQPM